MLIFKCQPLCPSKPFLHTYRHTSKSPAALVTPRRPPLNAIEAPPEVRSKAERYQQVTLWGKNLETGGRRFRVILIGTAALQPLQPLLVGVPPETGKDFSKKQQPYVKNRLYPSELRIMRYKHSIEKKKKKLIFFFFFFSNLCLHIIEIHCVVVVAFALEV